MFFFCSNVPRIGKNSLTKQEMTMRAVWVSGAVLISVLALTACQGKPSAVATRDAGSTTAYASSSGGPSDATGGARPRDPRDAPVPLIDGKPLRAANRKHTAEENAQFQFAKNGGDFDAKSESQYVSDAHSFVEKPPRDAEVIDRPNGDKLIYDPKKNIFAVVARNGAPRTMFKPRDGASYWAQQKDREAQRGKSPRDGSSDQG
jgi:pyocin large subunit-like protein